MGVRLVTELMAVASAAWTTQIGGDAVYDTTVCDSPPEGFTSYPGLRLTGSLEGCLYTGVVDSQFTPSGGYIETGQEMFVGSLNGGDDGTFTTNYRLQGEYEGDVEIHGRCQHPTRQAPGPRLRGSDRTARLQGHHRTYGDLRVPRAHQVRLTRQSPRSVTTGRGDLHLPDNRHVDAAC